MRDEEEIRQMLKYLQCDDEVVCPPPKTTPRSGYIFDKDQAIEILEWVLREY